MPKRRKSSINPISGGRSRKKAPKRSTSSEHTVHIPEAPASHEDAKCNHVSSTRAGHLTDVSVSPHDQLTVNPPNLMAGQLGSVVQVQGTDIYLEFINGELSTIEPAGLIVRRKIALALYSWISPFLSIEGRGIDDLCTLEPFRLRGGPAPVSPDHNDFQKYQRVNQMLKLYGRNLIKAQPMSGKMSLGLLQVMAHVGLTRIIPEEFPKQWELYLDNGGRKRKY
ncbi:uncharacterized protein JN550_009566 [Neoarthrinium moseri]|uniref:uncharacterized protein n=1 Tax=Neoarthrinium moseri TaxID=1658444 RepID=UPI001FDC6DA4|nr:uncharacterized protein JN550_009566 [Neoarthrinium moseri]KAI1863455.1 hypothetical protein JN550_009566 [Neoarthrinium moseri]